MANKVKVRNSVVAGRAPAAGTGTPGELWTNIADKKIGTFDATGNPIELGQHVSQAVVPFSASKAHAVGDLVGYQGDIYKAIAVAPPGPWDATKWAKVTGVFIAGSVPFAAADGSLTEDNAALFWDATNKRLGIGTSAPVNTLDVRGTAQITNNVYVGDSASTNPQIHFKDTAGGKAVIGINANEPAFTAYGPATKLTIGTTGQTPILFETAAGTLAGAEKMRIAPGGNVGVGTSGPGAKLHVKSTVPSAAIIEGSGANSSVSYHTGGGLTVRNSDATAGNTSFVSFAASASWDLAAIWSINTNHKAGGGVADLVFGTTNNNTAAQERMRIKADGSVGVGTTAPAAGYLLDVAGSVRVSGGGQTVAATNAQGRGWRMGNTSSGTNLGYFYIQGTTDNFAASFIDGLFLSSNGRMGLGPGTSAPKARLHIEGFDGLQPTTANVAARDLLVLENNNNANLSFLNGGGVFTSSIKAMRPGETNPYIEIVMHPNGGNPQLLFNVNNGEKARLSAEGMLGIGVSNPRGTLHLAPKTTAQIKAIVAPTKGAIEFCSDTNLLCFYNGTAWQKVLAAPL